ncbi:Vacuolar protein sorting-associated protein 30 [Exophiala dermatitidis]
MYCQKCRQPIRIDGSIRDLNPASFDLLIASTAHSQQNNTSASRLNYPKERKDLYDRVTGNVEAPIYKRTIPAPQHGTATGGPDSKNGLPDMSFIEITQSQVALHERDLSHRNDRGTDRQEGDKGTEERDKENLLSTQVAKTEALFSILSSRSDIDHPICSECTSLLLSAYNARLGGSLKEKDAYASFLKSVQQTVSSTPHGTDVKARKELSHTEKEEGTAYDLLIRTEGESRQVEEEIAALEEESQQMDRKEQVYWLSRNSFDDQLYQVTVRLLSLQEKYVHDNQQIERLQRTNVYNDTFCIGHDGYFGTINGLRLGRLPNQNVDWAEINAAWGQTLLLLAVVAERLKYTFQGYRLRPQGSTSRIEKLEYPQQAPGAARSNGTERGLHSASANPEPKVTRLDLFSSGDMAIGRLLNHRRFDAGMVAFLECLNQLGKRVERTSSIEAGTSNNQARNTSVRNLPPKRVLPYPIQGDKIGDVSIKLGVGFHQDENFTKACKHALTDCKFLLAYISNLEVGRVP